MAGWTMPITAAEQKQYIAYQDQALRERNLRQWDRDFAASSAAAVASDNEKLKRANDIPYGKHMAEVEQADRVRQQQRSASEYNDALIRNRGIPPGRSFGLGLNPTPAEAARIAAQKKEFDMLTQKAEAEYRVTRDRNYQNEMPQLIATYSKSLARATTSGLDSEGNNAINRINMLAVAYKGADKDKFLAPVRAAEGLVSKIVSAQSNKTASNSDQIVAFGLRPSTESQIIKADVLAKLNSKNSSLDRKTIEAYAAAGAAGKVLSNIVDKQKASVSKVTKPLANNKKKSKAARPRVSKLKKKS